MQEKAPRDAKILIVDDQEANIRLLTGLLRRVGYTNIRSTTESRDVLPLYTEFQPDLILLDLLMPERDGYAVIAQLNSIIPPGSYLPILVMTADVTTEARKRALGAGASDFLTKPIDNHEALLRIENLLQTRFLHLALQAQNERLEQKVSERTRELVTLHRLSEIALHSRSLDCSLSEMGQEIGKATDFPLVMIELYDAERQLMVLRGAWGLPESVDGHRLEFPVEDSLSGVVVRNMNPLFLTNVGEQRHVLCDLLAPLTFQTYAGIPMRAGDTLLGVLSLAHPEVVEIPADLPRFVTVLATHVASLVERQRSEEALYRADRRAVQEYSRLLARLTGLAQVMGTTQTLHAIYRALRDFIVASVPCNGLIVSHYLAEQQERQCVYIYAEGREEDVSLLPRMGMNDSPQSRAIQQRQSVVVNDRLDQPLQRPHVNLGLDIDPRLPRSSVAVPMIVQGRVLGVFEVQSVEVGAYKQEHVIAMEMAANLAAIATENVRLLERERLSREAAEVSERRFRGLVQQASDIITILNPSGTVLYHSPAFERVLGYNPEVRIGESAFEFVHPQDRPRLVELVGQVIREPGSVQTIEFRGRRADGSWRILESTISNLLEHPEIQGLVANTHDITERRQHEREMEAIAGIAAALREARNRAEMVPLILDHLMKLIEAEGAALVIQRVTGESVIERGAGVWAGATELVLPDESRSEQVMETGNPYLNNDTRSQPELTFADPRYQLTAMACVPLIAEGRSIGCIWVGRNLELTDQEVPLLKACADIAANALYRATLYEQTERRIQRMAALHAIDTAISASLDLRVTLNVFLDQVMGQLQVDGAAILLFNPHTKTLEFAAERGLEPQLLSREPLSLTRSYAGQVVLEREGIRLADFTQVNRERLPKGFCRLMEQSGFLAYFAVPLIAKGQIQGVLELFHRSPLHPDWEWVEFLQTLAAQAAIAIDNASLYDNLQRSNTFLTLAYDATIEGLSRALDLRDKETEGHSVRVTEMTLRLARAMGIGEEELIHLRWGALLHDIGKMGVPDSILLKPGTLDEEEWEIMRRHPTYAYELLSPITFLRPALEIPYAHHEKWDGTGYPRGLKGEQIPLAARIFAIVDVWDALCSDRPYRKAWPREKVLGYLHEQAGSHFDPRVVELFLRMLEEGEPDTVAGWRGG